MPKRRKYLMRNLALAKAAKNFNISKSPLDDNDATIPAIADVNVECQRSKRGRKRQKLYNVPDNEVEITFEETPTVDAWELPIENSSDPTYASPLTHTRLQPSSRDEMCLLEEVGVVEKNDGTKEKENMNRNSKNNDPSKPNQESWPQHCIPTRPKIQKECDKIKLISNQVPGDKPNCYNMDTVMEQIQNTLESMTRDELISFCKMKIEEEIGEKTAKLEKDKKIENLQKSLNTCLEEMTKLHKKNVELKEAVSTIYAEYKKGKELQSGTEKTPQITSISKNVNHNNDFIVTSLQPENSENNFILPDNPPNEPIPFAKNLVKVEPPTIKLENDQTETPFGEMPASSVAPLLLLPHNMNGNMNNNLSPSHYIIITSESTIIPPNQPSLQINPAGPNAPAAPLARSESPPEKGEIRDDNFDIEDSIPHALITCGKTGSSALAPANTYTNKNVNCSKSDAPKNANNVEVYKVLQSIDLTNKAREQNTDKLKESSDGGGSNLLNNCTPRIVCTTSLAHQGKSVCPSLEINITEALQQDSGSSNKSASHYIKDGKKTPITSPQLLPVSGDMPNATPDRLNPRKLAFVVNSAKGSQGQKQVFFTITPQNQGQDITNNNSPQISDVTSLSAPAASPGKARASEVFDLTEDEPAELSPAKKSKFFGGSVNPSACFKGAVGQRLLIAKDKSGVIKIRKLNKTYIKKL